jgi:5-methylcytosine-specific restriction enzyme A
MSTIRRQSAKLLRDHDGHVICSCGCGRKPPKGRRTWFSTECVNAWRERNDPAYIREQLWRRDKGICALCGCDSVEEYRRWREHMKEAGRLSEWFLQAWRLPESARQHWKLRATERRRITDRWKPSGAWTAGRRTSWDADHIVPVVEGGGLCDLSNYRTLCHPCHKQVTAELARRRAAAKKPVEAQQPELQFA